MPKYWTKPLNDKPMGTKIIVRQATTDDLVDLTRLNELFNEVKSTPERFVERLADPKCVEIPIVAQIDNRIVGFAGLRVVPSVFYEETQAELTEIYVEEPYRRQGVGKTLIRFAEDLAQKKGAQEIVLATDQENQEAQEFYRAMMYQEWSITMGKSFLSK